MKELKAQVGEAQLGQPQRQKEEEAGHVESTENVFGTDIVFAKYVLWSNGT